MTEHTTLPEDAPERDPADAHATPDGGAGVRPPDAAGAPVVARSARSLLWQARAGLVVGLLGLVLAAVSWSSAADLRAEADRAERALDAGEVIALRVTTFAGEDIDGWVADTQRLATGEYADEIAQLLDPELRQGLADAGVESVGEVLSSFVQDVDEDEATVFLVLRQTYTSAMQLQPVSDELRMEVELRLVDGEWLATDVAILGPSTIAPIDPAAGAASEPAGPAAGDPAGG